MRPRLATGVPFRGGQPDERGQPGVAGDAPEGYGSLSSRAIDNGYPELRPRDYEQPIPTTLHPRRPPVGHAASNQDGSATGARITLSIERKEAAACPWIEPRIRGRDQSTVFLFVHHHPKRGERVAEWREAALEQQE